MLVCLLLTLFSSLLLTGNIKLILNINSSASQSQKNPTQDQEGTFSGAENNNSEADTSETDSEGEEKTDIHNHSHSKDNKSETKVSKSNPSIDSADSADIEESVIDTYSDNNIQISISEVTGYDLAYYVADIQLSSTEQLKTAFAYGQYGGSRQYTSTMAKNNNAILAINGDYYNYRTDAIIIRNSILYRDMPSSRQMLIIDQNGDFSFAYENEVDADQLIEENVLQTLSFGPALVIKDIVQEIPSSYFIKTDTTEPRCAIGQIDELHYVFVIVDGRNDGYSIGVTLEELADIMSDLGCINAYNLDGGGSATMVFQNEVINNPSNGGDGGERSISDIIYIK